MYEHSSENPQHNKTSCSFERGKSDFPIHKRKANIEGGRKREPFIRANFMFEEFTVENFNFIARKMIKALWLSYHHENAISTFF